VNKSTWVIAVEYNGCFDKCYWWEIYLRSDSSIKFTGMRKVTAYTTFHAALRGARRMAKRLRISAEVET